MSIHIEHKRYIEISRNFFVIKAMRLNKLNRITLNIYFQRAMRRQNIASTETHLAFGNATT